MEGLRIFVPVIRPKAVKSVQTLLPSLHSKLLKVFGGIRLHPVSAGCVPQQYKTWSDPYSERLNISPRLFNKLTTMKALSVPERESSLQYRTWTLISRLLCPARQTFCSAPQSGKNRVLEESCVSPEVSDTEGFEVAATESLIEAPVEEREASLKVTLTECLKKGTPRGEGFTSNHCDNMRTGHQCGRIHESQSTKFCRKM
ncbi:uncharacterized protein LOC122870377 [Scomber scombrus]|uniref:Uncharacterized protein LOC122870377 n=1 Tax=Scomber scombrus TaxID=13677 RepID=A0AAV1P8T6_SCOSC